jgi:hypothetical protein
LVKVKVLNSGAWILSWSASADVAWLGISTTTGDASFVGEQIEVIQLHGLAAGSHTGTITFSAAGVSNQTLVVTIDSYEDDHASVQNQATRITTGSTVSGRIQSSEDNDWFTLEVDSPGLLTVSTTGATYIVGELHGQEGPVQIAYGSPNFRIERVVLPGRYWLKVEGNSNWTGPFELHNSFAPEGPEFAVKSIASAAGGTQWSLTVATTVGYRYYVEESSTLGGTWTKVGDTVVAVDEETILTVNAPEPSPLQHFYRVAVEAP